ncbi:hypothetical protein [Xenorhabdus bovienii]|uniref:hypothetical protein n=1 Tax=Xenorhabdus bovienii TaxID=40576 RepID=UPI00237C8B02|nr:hypothetical protein [Xenorhabdus bovienii]MDE1475249.1 hypothetical protein [Xenorhabdus bovienii]
MSNSITVSVDDKSNVIVGQVLIIDIIFKSDSNMQANYQFELKNLINATASNTCFSITNSDDNFSMTTELYIDKNISTGDIVSFDIVPNEYAVGFSTKTINYTAHEVDLDSLSFYFEKDVIPALVTDGDNIPPNGRSYTRASAIVKNKSGHPLPNVSMDIMGNYSVNLSKINVYYSHNDPDWAVPVGPIQEYGGQQIIPMVTDKDGKMDLYIYPTDKSQFVFDLKTSVSDTGIFVPSRNKVYIIDYPSNYAKPILAPPNILGFRHGQPVGDDNSSTFLVSIASYNNARPSDTILFYVDGVYSQQQVIINNVANLNSFFIRLPYTIFPVNKLANFSYLIVSSNGNIQSSFELCVMYGGGGKQSLDSVTRVYDACTVYSSLGSTIPINLVIQNDVVNYFTISNYMKNSGHDGLFVVITGTNDPTDKTKVPFGAEVTLNFRIESYKKSVYKTFTKTMPTQPDKGSKNAATLIIGIPYQDINDVESYPNGSAGRVYFDYQVNELGKITYGKTWEARIDTAPPLPIEDADN